MLGGFHKSKEMNGPNKQHLGLENDRKKFAIFKLIYFIFFGSFGSLLPVLPLFFDVKNEFSKYEIGILCMIPV